MSRYEEADLTRVRAHSVTERESLVAAGDAYRPPADPRSFEQFWDSLPEVLGARALKETVRAIHRARAAGHGFALFAGAHVIKTGMSPGVIRLLEEGWVTSLALNGAGAIHDLELAFFGATSEDVAAGLHQGRFGMARETSVWLNEWTEEAARRDEGLGEGLGRSFLERADAAGASRSLLATCYRLGIPATVHLSIGTDINQQHASFSGAAAGETSARDFRILVARVARLSSGVVLVVGSAVLLPEVFLKALSVSANLGARFDGLTTAVFDFQRHYRPEQNVVLRPTQVSGRGHYVIGHHELLLPLLCQALRLRPSPGTPELKASQSEADS